MPRGDGIGPTGQGSGMGRGAGINIGQTKGRMGGQFAAGPGGNCVCPNCGTTKAHVAGQPCSMESCPNCGNNMIRG